MRNINAGLNQFNKDQLKGLIDEEARSVNNILSEEEKETSTNACLTAPSTRKNSISGGSTMGDELGGSDPLWAVDILN